MVAQTAHIIIGLLPAVFGKRVRYIVDIAGIHQILPYDQPFFITEIIKSIGRVVTATPYTDAVKVCPAAAFQNIIQLLFGNSCVQTVIRNIVSPAGKNFDTIDTEGGFISPFVFFLADR